MVGVEELSIPGLQQEPLDPFYDDVFAGLDEPTAGPWPHHSILDCPELHPSLEQHPPADSHFPAIDCNLLEEQLHADAAAAANLQHGQGSSISGSLHLEPPCFPTEHLHASCHTAAQQQGVGLREDPGSSQHSKGLQDTEGEDGALPLGYQQGSASSTSSAQDEAVDEVDSAAGAAQEAAAAAELAVSCSADADADAVATGAERPAGAAAAGGFSMHAADSCGCNTPSADTTPVVAVAVAEPATPQGEPSSGSSLPDIDDVPEEQAGLQEPQQHQEGVLQLQDDACAEPWQQQQQEGEFNSQEQLGVAAPQLLDVPLACSTGSLGAPAEAKGGCQAGSGSREAGASCSPDCSAAAAAATGGCSIGEEQACPEQQQLSVHAEDEFGSPCSSWHSCVTAASNQTSTSSMTSRRGFLLHQPPTVPAASVAAAAADAEAGVGSDPAATQHSGFLSDGAELEHQHHEQQEQEQEASSGGISSPPLVSSLHLALQQQQQQWPSQHSEQLAASAVSDDPLTAGLALSVSSLAAGIAERPDHAVTAAAAAGADADHSSSAAAGSQPIAMQRLHQQEELWQDVSPPSFSSSPGLLVSAVAARAAAAAVAQQEQQQQAGQQEAVSADAVDAAAEAAETAVEQQEGGDVVEHEDDVGQGCFYAAAADGLSMSPEQGFLQQHMAMLQHRGPGLHQQQHLNNSSYMLRQSELVDLSLSTSMHPSMQQQALQHPGWLTAHQQLPPAAAQAVERAVVALNDSYCYPGGRTSPSEVLGVAAAAGARGGSSAAAIRRSGALQQWNRAHTQPQQDQQARHRLPSQAAAGGPGPFGWPGAAVLGDWFSSTVQQPLAAAASRAAVGVGQRLGMAHAQQLGVAGSGRSQTNSSWTGTAPGGGVNAASGAAQGVGVLPQGAAGSSGVGSSGMSRLAPVDGDAAVAGLGGAEVLEESVDDAVLVEKTSDLPQSLQEQEDEAFRGLLFLGGRDSQGRPVLIINTDAIPAGHNSAPRDAALAYLLKRLSPVVTRGPYVLVIVALHSGPQFRLLPGVWCVRAYQSLPRAFRKHVKHVILLQPSMLVKAAVTLLYPFVSSKAHAKVKQVQRLLDIDAATSGEVQVPHLGEAFLTTIHHINSSRAHQHNGAA